jgi:hypothetical protein
MGKRKCFVVVMLIGTVFGLTDNEDLYGDNSMDMLHGDNEKVVEEFDEDTDDCKENAIQAHPDDPNIRLNHFLMCLKKKLKTFENEETEEVHDIKKTLELITGNSLFNDETIDHRFRRDVEEELVVEGRGRKKNGKRKDKKKNKEERREEKRKNKKNKKKHWDIFQPLEESMEAVEEQMKKKKIEKKLEKKVEETVEHYDDDEYEEEEDEKEEVHVIEKEENIKSESTENKDRFTSGLQISAYSGNNQPQYHRPESKPNKFMYAMDYQGNAQYMDEDQVSALLQTNPQAMKAIMNYLASNEEGLMPPSDSQPPLAPIQPRTPPPPPGHRPPGPPPGYPHHRG